MYWTPAKYCYCLMLMNIVSQMLHFSSPNTVSWHFHSVQYNMILHTSLQLPRQNTNQSVNPQKTPQTGKLWGVFGEDFQENWWHYNCPHHILFGPLVVVHSEEILSWWCHQMETFSTLLAFCAGNSPVTGEFPSQRPVTQSFNVFFDLHLNQQLSKQWRRWWFETHCAHYDVTVMSSRVLPALCAVCIMVFPHRTPVMSSSP